MSQIKAAYNWAKKISLSSIRFIENIQTLTIRQLKAIASKVNRELGQVICKATFGKTLSNMRKQELINSIWFVRSLQMASPKGKFDLRELTQRIFAMLCDGDAHVYYFGFKKDGNGTAEQNANRFQKHLAIKGLCTLISIRKADRLKPYGFEWEAKVWGINEDTLMKLLTKDKAKKAEGRGQRAEGQESISSLLPRGETKRLLPSASCHLPFLLNPNAAVRDKFVVVDDAYGWMGSTGKVIEDRDKYVFAKMDQAEGKATFNKSQIIVEENVTIEMWEKTCQKMYDACREGSQASVAVIKFAERRGLEVVNGKVEIKF